MENTEIKLHFLDYWRIVKLRFGLILLTFFLVVITTCVYVMFLPKKWLSTVTIEIKPDGNRAFEAIGNNGSRMAGDPNFIATQFQVIRKNEILYPVIDKLGLVKQYTPAGSPDYPKSLVAAMLANELVVQDRRGTSLVEIGIYHTNRDLGAQIANTIANVYAEMRIQSQQKSFSSARSEIEQELRNQQTKVEKLAKEATTIRTEQNIVDPDPENAGAQLSLSGEKQLYALEQLMNEQQAKVDQIANQLLQIQNLKEGELMVALRTLNIEDPTISAKLPLFQDAAVRENELISAGLGENHPRIRAIRGQRDTLQKILSEALESIQRSQATKLKVEEANLKTYKEKAEKARQGHIEEKTNIGKYVEKKTEYLMAKQLMQVVEQRKTAAVIDSQVSFEPVRVWQKAERAPEGAAADQPVMWKWIGLAVVIGLVMGIALAFFIEYLDTSVKTIEDIERYLQLNVLAVVPRDISILYNQRREGPDAEVYRILMANLELTSTDRENNTYTLVSGGPGEGKSTTLNNLAVTFARSGEKRILVVDADLRRPSQHRLFGVENTSGLSEYIQGRASVQEVTRTTKLPNLFFISSGKLADDAGILNSKRMEDLIAQLRGQYDAVFFDSPPILGVSDASNLASWIDNTVMVIQHRRFPRAMLQRVKQSVGRVGGTLRGVVLNNVDTKHDDAYSYYSSYEYYSGAKNRTQEPATAGTKKHDNEDY